MELMESINHYSLRAITDLKHLLLLCMIFISPVMQIRVATVSEKSGKNETFLRSGKSQGILFSGLWLISFLQDFEKHFLSEKMKSILQSQQGDQFDTLCLTHVVFVVSGFR